MPFNQALLDKEVAKREVSRFDPAKLREVVEKKEPKEAEKVRAEMQRLREFKPSDVFKLEEKFWKEKVRPFVKKAGKVFQQHPQEDI